MGKLFEADNQPTTIRAKLSKSVRISLGILLFLMAVPFILNGISDHNCTDGGLGFCGIDIKFYYLLLLIGVFLIFGFLGILKILKISYSIWKKK